MRETGVEKEGKKVLLPLLISILVALGITYLILTHLPIIILGVMLFIVAALIFAFVLSAAWFLMQLVLLPYYAMKRVKPKEEESKGGYRIEDVKPAKSEITHPEKGRPRRIYCPRCGIEVPRDAEFCPNCGMKIK